MDNQHKKIKGYRDFNEDCIRRINELKAKEKEILDLVEHLRHQADQNLDSPDRRWEAIGITDIQKGFMALIRSHAKPE